MAELESTTIAGAGSSTTRIVLIARQLEEMKPRVAKLAALNSRYQADAMYHTHSGIGLVGASIWDLYIVLKDFDPQAVGVNYDIGHATIEGGFGGWINSFRITGPHLRGIAVKDFLWEKDKQGWKADFKPLGRGWCTCRSSSAWWPPRISRDRCSCTSNIRWAAPTTARPRSRSQGRSLRRHEARLAAAPDVPEGCGAVSQMQNKANSIAVKSKKMA